MSQNKRMSRKTSRIVRMPATRFGHIQKRLRQADRRAQRLPPRHTK